MRRSGRQRTKSRRQQEADEALETANDFDAHDVASDTAQCATIAPIAALSAVGAGKKTCADMPDPKSYKASLEVADAQLWEQTRAEKIASLVTNQT